MPRDRADVRQDVSVGAPVESRVPEAESDGGGRAVVIVGDLSGRDGRPPRCDEIKAALEDYPLYNEEDYSNRCCEEQYQAVDQMVRDFDNKLYQYVDPDTGEDLTEMTEEEMEYIVGTWCHRCNSDDQRPSDDELWSAYWKVHGHLLHCTIHGPYPDNDPCPCQMRLALFDEAQPETTAR